MLKLGWRNPRPNDFQTEDLRPLRDLFGNLQHFMTWPYVGLRFDGAHGLTTGLVAIPFTVHSSATSPFVSGDPYNLYRPTPRQIQVPRDFDTWLAIGSAGFATTGGLAADVFTAGWRVNGVTDVYFGQVSGVIGSRISLPFMTPVKKGDTIDIVAATNPDNGEDLAAAEAWIFFLPLA